MFSRRKNYYTPGNSTFASNSRGAFFLAKTTSETVQRKCSSCEEKDEHVQRKENSGHGNSAVTSVSNFLSSAGSNGSPLPQSTRSFFEPKFGHDFSSVRIHTGEAAAQSARSVNALAYTHGNNIVFNANQFSPESDTGKKLLAHELTHVIQQSDASGQVAPMIQRQQDKDPAELSDEELQSEYESYRAYIYSLSPDEYRAEEGNMEYYNQLEREVKKRCVKDPPNHPAAVSDKLIDRITGKYAKVDGDPGEGMFHYPYMALEGQCTIGYGHVVHPKSLCTITGGDDNASKKCMCAAPYNYFSDADAIAELKKDLVIHQNEVHKKIKVNLNEAEFDAMVDLSAHHGSIPQTFADYVNKTWCTDKDAVRSRYLVTEIKMKDPDTKQLKVMKGFVDRRKRRVW